LGFSAYYHNNCCISEEKLYYLRKFDLAGIAIMISGGATPPLYYAFMCAENIFYQRLYLGLVWVCSFTALFVGMHPRQRDFKNNWILALSFIIAGYSVAPGVLHLTFFMEGKFVRDFPFLLFFIAGNIYAVGAVLYATKWPEKSFPGKFDCFGNSHNIFHVCCVIGAVLAWWGSIRVFHERQLYSCPV